MAGEVLGYSRDVVRLGVDGENLAVLLHIGGAGLERVFHHLVFLDVAVLVVDDDNALLVKAPAHAAGLTHVVGHGLDYDGDAARTVALVGDGLVVVRAAAAERLVDGALDVVIGHVGRLGLGNDGGEAGVVGRVAASALFDRDYHLAGYLGKGLGALCVLCALGLLYIMPLGMSRHIVNPCIV